jgi:predicted nucleotidyltransferase
MRKYSASEIEAAVGPIVSRIYQTVNPRKLFLLGSAVTGGFDDASDVDFLVVMDTSESAKEALFKLNRIRPEFSRSIDFVCMEEARFSILSEQGGIAWVARNEGKLLLP